ncbi:MAG: alpha/beta fold hydrolase, partial [Nocardioidaceae bacterium]
MRTRATAPVPRLDVLRGNLTEARDLVVLAHGGQEHSYELATDYRAPLLRMWPLAAAAAAAAPAACVTLMRYRYRGWNGDNADAGADLRTVLERLPETTERIVLVGHSMGGRAVMASADAG